MPFNDIIIPSSPRGINDVIWVEKQRPCFFF